MTEECEENFTHVSPDVDHKVVLLGEPVRAVITLKRLLSRLERQEFLINFLSPSVHRPT